VAFLCHFIYAVTIKTLFYFFGDLGHFFIFFALYFCMVKFKDYTILVVEDEESIRESFIKCFSMLFKKVYAASDGEDGLRAWNRNSPDIIITDIYLPKMSGIELVKLIREQDNKIPIIFMSARSDPDTFIETIPISADGYMIKPFSFESCLENLHKCIQKLEKNNSALLTLKSGAIVDMGARTVLYENIVSTLTEQEFKLLSVFLNSQDGTATQSVISSVLWGGEPRSSSALKNLLLKMRKKLGVESIDTLIGHGYKLNVVR